MFPRGETPHMWTVDMHGLSCKCVYVQHSQRRPLWRNKDTQRPRWKGVTHTHTHTHPHTLLIFQTHTHWRFLQVTRPFPPSSNLHLVQQAMRCRSSPSSPPHPSSPTLSPADVCMPKLTDAEMGKIGAWIFRAMSKGPCDYSCLQSALMTAFLRIAPTVYKTVQQLPDSYV